MHEPLKNYFAFISQIHIATDIERPAKYGKNSERYRWYDELKKDDGGFSTNCNFSLID